MPIQSMKQQEFQEWAPCEEISALALHLGLSVRVHWYGSTRKGTGFWMIRTLAGRELGSYVPRTGSWRAVGKRGRSDDWKAVLRIYAAVAKETGRTRSW